MLWKALPWNPGQEDSRAATLREPSRSLAWATPQRLSERALAVNTLDPSLSNYSPPTEVESSGATCKPRPLATRVPRSGSTWYQ